MKLLIARTLGIAAPHGTRAFSDSELINIIDAFKFGGRVDIYLDTREPGPGLYDSISGRDFIINLAGDSDTTGARGLFGANFWVDQCLSPYDNYPHDVVIGITDLRFDIEADRVHALGGAVVKINRDSSEGGRSEQGIDPTNVDYVIDNNKFLDDLHVAVWNVANSEWCRG